MVLFEIYNRLCLIRLLNVRGCIVLASLRRTVDLKEDFVILAHIAAGVPYVVWLCLNTATCKLQYCSSLASHRAPPDQRYQLDLLEYFIYRC